MKKEIITETYLYEALNDHYEALKSILISYDKGFITNKVALNNFKNHIDFNRNMIKSRLNKLKKESKKA